LHESEVKMPATLADLLALVIPEPEKCKAEAASLAADHVNEAREQVALHAVAQAKRWAAAGSATYANAHPAK
jgi:hypothetical protein